MQLGAALPELSCWLTRPANQSAAFQASEQSVLRAVIGRAPKPAARVPGAPS